jgi:hypothetical protein
MRFWGLIQRRLLTLFPSYRPERHYMRGRPEMAGTARSPVRRPSQGAHAVADPGERSQRG